MPLQVLLQHIDSPKSQTD